MRREAQQEAKCWGCGQVGHRLWTCPTKAVYPPKGEAQQERKVVCRECKGENHIARNCNSYWSWREQELRRKIKELKELKEKAKGEERVVRRTMWPLRAVWMKIGLEKVDTHEGMTVNALLDSGATGLLMNKKFIEDNVSWIAPTGIWLATMAKSLFIFLLFSFFLFFKNQSAITIRSHNYDSTSTLIYKQQ